jgi:hypothetical protein
MRTLLGFGGGFVFFDPFLHCLLKGLLEKRSAFGQEKVFEIVEGLAISGVVGDLIALVEQGVEFRVEKVTGGPGGWGLHRNTSL